MGDLSNPSVPTVLVTGFGPFRHHTQNSSWLTIQELLKLDIKDIHFVAKEIPVEYETVSNSIPKLIEELKPALVVHCGMSEKAPCLILEQIAHNENYCNPDVQGKLPIGNICCQDGPSELQIKFDIQKVIDDVNCSSVKVKAQASENAGKFVCEFTFYTSLKINENTAFVHVPLLDQPYSVREMAESLAVVIQSLLKQCSC